MNKIKKCITILIFVVSFYNLSQNSIAQVKVGETYPFSTWDNLIYFYEDLAAVSYKSNWGFIDKTGKLIIQPQFDAVNNFSEGLAAIYINKKHGYIDKTGKVVIQPIYNTAGDFNNDVAPVSLDKNNGYGYIDKAGKQIVPFEYELTSKFSNGIGLCRKAGTSNYIDNKGKILFSINCLKSGAFSEGYAWIYNGEGAFFINTKGQPAIPQQISGSKIGDKMDLITNGYFYAQDFSEGNAPVKCRLDNKWYFAGYGDRLSYNCSYDEVNAFKYGYAVVKYKGKWGMINKAHKEVLPFIYESISFRGSEPIAVKQNGKYGFVNFENKKILPFLYEDATGFSNGEAIVSSSGNYWSYAGNRKDPMAPIYRVDYYKINQFGECIKNCPEVGKTYQANYWEEKVPFINSDFIVKKIGKWAIINKEGKLISKLEYDKIEKFNDNCYLISINGKLGYIDTTGKILISPDLGFTEINPFINGRAIVKKDGKYGCINTKNEIIIPCEYDKLGNFNDGYASISIQGKYGSIDSIGKIVVMPEYDELIFFVRNWAFIKKGGKFGMIDKTGQIVIPIKYESLSHPLGNGLMFASKDSKYGYIDKTDKTIIPFQFDDAVGFYNGLAKVKLNMKFGFIDGSGKQVIPCQYDEASNFKNGLSNVKKDKLFGVIDTTGKTIVPLEFTHFSEFYDYNKGENTHFFCVAKEFYMLGLYNSKGQLIIPLKYKFISLLDDCERPYYSTTKNLFKVYLKGNWGVIDGFGKIIVPIKYEGVCLKVSEQKIIATKGNKSDTYNIKGELLK